MPIAVNLARSRDAELGGLDMPTAINLARSREAELGGLKIPIAVNLARSRNVELGGLNMSIMMARAVHYSRSSVIFSFFSILLLSALFSKQPKRGRRKMKTRKQDERKKINEMRRTRRTGARRITKQEDREEH